MIDIFVKVSGKLRRYATEYSAEYAYDMIETLRQSVVEENPEATGPVLGLIQQFDKQNA